MIIDKIKLMSGIPQHLQLTQKLKPDDYWRHHRFANKPLSKLQDNSDLIKEKKVNKSAEFKDMNSRGER